MIEDGAVGCRVGEGEGGGIDFLLFFCMILYRSERHVLFFVQHLQPLDFLVLSKKAYICPLDVGSRGCVVQSEIVVVEAVELNAIVGVCACGWSLHEIDTQTYTAAKCIRMYHLVSDLRPSLFLAGSRH